VPCASWTANARIPDTASPAPPLPYPESSGGEDSGYRWVPLVGAVSGIRVEGPPMRRIAAVARRQRGHVSRGQLLAAGISQPAIDRFVAAGYLFRVHRGVFAVGHRTPGIELAAETAAILAVRAGAVLSHQSAAVLWGFGAGHDADGLIHLTVPGSPGGHPTGVCVHRSTILEPRDLRIRRGVPVTAPARTLLDRAGSATMRDLEWSLDAGLVHGTVTPAAITELLGRCGRHRGRRPLERLLVAHTSTTFTRSEAQEHFLSLIRQAELPLPQTNVRRYGYELDFFWPEYRLVVEIDGFAFHRTHRSFERDRRRDARLVALGITVMRITWRQLTDEPLATIATLAQSIAAPHQ
jgi:very-short-patch-repair endonuclease